MNTVLANEQTPAFRVLKSMRRIAYYVLAILFALSANTLFIVDTPYAVDIASYLTVTLTLVVIALLWFSVTARRSFLKWWSIWAIAACLAYIVVSLANRTPAWSSFYSYLVLIVALPLMTHLMKQTGELSVFARAFINAITVLGLVSVLLWLLGDVLQIIQPNCEFTTYWGMGDRPAKRDGYFFLCYDVQLAPEALQPFHLGERPLYRNTGIYCEAPMYSFALCCALLLELYLQDKPRTFVGLAIVISIITSISITGIVMVLIVVFCQVNKRLSGSIVAKVAGIVIALGICAAMVVLVGWKLSTGSGNMRIDDFIACFKAWADSPLFGNGFHNEIAIHSHMNNARMNATGLANSFGYVMATGGLIYLSIYLVALSGFFKCNDGTRLSTMGICYAFIWAVTIVVTMPLAAFMFSIGVERMGESGYWIRR